MPKTKFTSDSVSLAMTRYTEAGIQSSTSPTKRIIFYSSTAKKGCREPEFVWSVADNVVQQFRGETCKL